MFKLISSLSDAHSVFARSRPNGFSAKIKSVCMAWGGGLGFELGSLGLNQGLVMELWISHFLFSGFLAVEIGGWGTSEN